MTIGPAPRPHHAIPPRASETNEEPIEMASISSPVGDLYGSGRPFARSMTLLLLGALLLVNGCATNGVKRRPGRPEAFAAAFDVTTGRQLWVTHIRPPISGLSAAAMDGDQFVVDGTPPMRSCAGNDLEIAFDRATGAEVRRGRPRKLAELQYPLTDPVIAQTHITSSCTTGAMSAESSPTARFT
jgi:hypothetical protein